MEDDAQGKATASPAFSDHLKLAVSARDLFVLDGERVLRVDQETGVVWTLSMGENLSQGKPTSIGKWPWETGEYVGEVSPKN